MGLYVAMCFYLVACDCLVKRMCSSVSLYICVCDVNHICNCICRRRLRVCKDLCACVLMRSAVMARGV